LLLNRDSISPESIWSFEQLREGLADTTQPMNNIIPDLGAKDGFEGGEEYNNNLLDLYVFHLSPTIAF